METTYTECMADIETLDTAETAVVLSVALVPFNLSDEDTWESLKNRGVHVFLNPQVQHLDKRTVSMDTVGWWMSQSNEARKVMEIAMAQNEHPRVTLGRTLEILNSVKHVWGNGSGFDNVILRNLFNTYGMDFLMHWNDRDLRTLKDLSGQDKIHKPEGMIAHDALDDAKYQVLCAQHYWRSLNGQTLGSSGG